MAEKRVWLWAGGALGAALMLWGLFPWGRAADVVPENVATVSVPVEAESPEEDAVVQKYQAGRGARSRPLRDPFRISTSPEPVTASSPALSAVGPASGNGRGESITQTSVNQPILRGTLILGEDRRAVIEWNGKVVTVREGEQVGPWQVTAITRKEAILAGPGMETVLSLP